MAHLSVSSYSSAPHFVCGWLDISLHSSCPHPQDVEFHSNKGCTGNSGILPPRTWRAHRAVFSCCVMRSCWLTLRLRLGGWWVGELEIWFTIPKQKQKMTLEDEQNVTRVVCDLSGLSPFPNSEGDDVCFISMFEFNLQWHWVGTSRCGFFEQKKSHRIHYWPIPGGV